MRSRAVAALAFLVALVATGCVSVPNDGPVVETRSGGDVSSEQGVYIDPRPPQPGDTRPEIVTGFINAMQAFPIRTDVAREFLSKDAAASWRPTETVTYSEPPTPRETDDGVAVRLSDPHRLDSRGAWQGALPPDDRTVTFPMVFEDGEWRIDQAPDALIVSEAWFEQWFRQVSLYFFDPTATMLAPEPVYVPRGEALATTLTRGLLMGPGDGLGRVMQSFVPRGLKVSVGVAVSDEGIADIPLTGDAGQLTPNAIELMMAQFAWTLRQEPAVEGIRVSIDGEPVPLPGGVSSYRIDGGAEYDPAGFHASPLLYGLQDGRVVSGSASALVPVNGPLGSDAYGLRSLGVDLTASSAAGVTDDGRAVVVGPLSSGDKGDVYPVAPGGTDYLRPAWDFADRIWLVDRTPGGARVSYVEDDQATSLRMPGITGEQVRMFLVSRDGTRLVAVLRGPSGNDILVVSRIEHSSSGRVVGATRAERISAEGELQLPVRAIAWRTPTSVAVLSPFTRSVAQVQMASVDGSPVGQDSTSASVEGRIRSLAGSPVAGEPLYGITPRSLVDVFSSDRRVLPLGDGISVVVYVG